MTRVERVLSRLGIAYKRGGKELTALCPNPAHDDSSPSWRIRDEDGGDKDGMHHCFPCGFSGDLISLVRALHPGMTYPAAVEWLAGDAEAPRREVESVSLQVRRRPIFELPPHVEPSMPLDQWPPRIREYLLNRNKFGNNVTAAQVARWGITFARKGPLGGRIVIPYADSNNVLGGYTARSYTGDRRRYLEPEPDVDGSSLGALFGERHWPPPASRNVLFVTEGAFNAMAVERALGDVSIAALAGSQIRVQHATKLVSWPRLVLVSDPDGAGDVLAEKVRVLVSRYGRPTVRAAMPPGSDADSLPLSQLSEILFVAFNEVLRAAA